MSSEISKKRVVVYIDGFNLYEGLLEQGWRKYLWLDLQAFSESLIFPDQSLIAVKYFTTRVSYPYERKKRQTTFIDALGTLSKILFFYGNFSQDDKTCDRCGAIVYFPVEKQTDVNIASEMLMDAHQGAFDTAILVSGDSDLVAPVRYIKQFWKDKSIVVAFPPKRESYELESVATTAYRIVKKKFRDNQFSPKIILPSGVVLERPESWK